MKNFEHSSYLLLFEPIFVPKIFQYYYSMVSKSILNNRKLLFVVIPCVLFIFPHLFLLTGGYFDWIMPNGKETGFVEYGTAMLFFLGGIYAFFLSAKSPIKEKLYIRIPVIFFGILAIFVCLEEISFGQHLLFFGTPEWFNQFNTHNETNLHNLSDNRLSKAMRTAGYILVTIVGIIAPLIVWLKKISFSPANIFRYFIPEPLIIVASLFHLFANLPKNLISLFPNGGVFVSEHNYFNHSGEYEEYALGFWVLLFVVSMHRSILKVNASTTVSE
ncbi:MAG: hypothetical protein P1U58_17690 [Verrucomicrobiales bacterium]|nr:hypothetical protein [Verrucomicrobiales bacterium]